MPDEDVFEDEQFEPPLKTKRKGIPQSILLYRRFRESTLDTDDPRRLLPVLGVLLTIIVGAFVCGLVVTSAAKNNASPDIAIAESELAKLRIVLDKQLPIWQHQADIQNGAYERDDFQSDSVSLHFPIDADIGNIHYGYCLNAEFYVYVLKNARPREGIAADILGYAHISNSTSPSKCHPSSWHMALNQQLADNWYLVAIDTSCTKHLDADFDRCWNSD
ncbi:MAG: hypothetical protein ABI947_13805 [Chloroflexota bacterium]